MTKISLFFCYLFLWFCLCRTRPQGPQGIEGPTGFTGFTGPTGPARSGSTFQNYLKAIVSGNQSFTSGTTDVPITSWAVTDSNGWLTPLSSTFTCSVTQFYLIFYNLAFAHNADSQQAIVIQLYDNTAAAYVDGTGIAQQYALLGGSSLGQNNQNVAYNGLANLVAGHTYELRIRNLTWVGSSGIYGLQIAAASPPSIYFVPA